MSTILVERLCCEEHYPLLVLVYLQEIKVNEFAAFRLGLSGYLEMIPRGIGHMLIGMLQGRAERRQI